MPPTLMQQPSSGVAGRERGIQALKWSTVIVGHKPKVAGGREIQLFVVRRVSPISTARRALKREEMTLTRIAEVGFV